MDKFDLAQEMDAKYRNLHIDTMLRQSRGDVGLNRTTCLECDDVIPEDRRAAEPGCLRCVGCQSEYEEQLC